MASYIPMEGRMTGHHQDRLHGMGLGAWQLAVWEKQATLGD